MTKDQQAELEQAARELLSRIEDYRKVRSISTDNCHSIYESAFIRVVSDFLASQRVTVLEEVIADAKRRAYAIGLNEPLRTNYLYGFACDLESQLKEQRP